MTEAELNAFNVAAAEARKVFEAAKLEWTAAVARLDQAKRDFASRHPHKWAGMNVVREEIRRAQYKSWHRGGTKPDKTVTVKGVVTLAGTGRNNYRNHQPAPGEWFVLSESGATAYSLTNGGEWSLA